jgi:hypothetical protein
MNAAAGVKRANSKVRRSLKEGAKALHDLKILPLDQSLCSYFAHDECILQSCCCLLQDGSGEADAPAGTVFAKELRLPKMKRSSLALMQSTS